MLQQDYNFITQKIIHSAIEVHKALGPGLMESVYEVCLCQEMQNRGLFVQRQVILPVAYKGMVLEKEFIIDQLIDGAIILELKSVETILPVHEAQLLTYLKLSEKKLGLLINFNVPVLVQGIRRKINGLLPNGEQVV